MPLASGITTLRPAKLSLHTSPSQWNTFGRDGLPVLPTPGMRSRMAETPETLGGQIETDHLSAGLRGSDRRVGCATCDIEHSFVLADAGALDDPFAHSPQSAPGDCGEVAAPRRTDDTPEVASETANPAPALLWPCRDRVWAALEQSSLPDNLDARVHYLCVTLSGPITAAERAVS